MLSKPVASAILICVTVVWLVNFGLQFVPALDYKSDPLIHGLFMTVVGGALAFTKKSEGEQPPASPGSPTDPAAGGRHRAEGPP